MSDAFQQLQHETLLALKRSVQSLNQPGSLDGLLALHFDTHGLLGGREWWQVYCDPARWLSLNLADLDQAPAIAILGCLIAEQSRRLGSVETDVQSAFRQSIVKLQQRRDVFALPNSWVLQPALVIGITLGIRTTGDQEFAAWVLQLLQEGSSRSDTPLLLQLACQYSMTVVSPTTQSPSTRTYAIPIRISSIPELSFALWLVKRQKIVAADETVTASAWVDAADAALLGRLLTEEPYEVVDFKAALVLEVVSSYVQARSRLRSLDLVSSLLDSFPAAMERWKAKWKIDDEYDVQSVLWLILRTSFPDLRYEERLPKLGRSAEQYDIGIPELGLIVEAKYTRDVKDFQKVVNEIAEDSAKLRTQTVFKEIIVFVYDRSCSVEQHTWTRQALESIASVRRAIIVGAPSMVR